MSTLSQFVDLHGSISKSHISKIFDNSPQFNSRTISIIHALVTL